MGTNYAVVLTPNEIFSIAERSPEVRAALSYWQRGELNWEQALAYAVVALFNANERLEKSAVKDLENSEFRLD